MRPSGITRCEYVNMPVVASTDVETRLECSQNVLQTVRLAITTDEQENRQSFGGV